MGSLQMEAASFEKFGDDEGFQDGGKESFARAGIDDAPTGNGVAHNRQASAESAGVLSVGSSGVGTSGSDQESGWVPPAAGSNLQRRSSRGSVGTHRRQGSGENAAAAAGLINAAVTSAVAYGGHRRTGSGDGYMKLETMPMEEILQRPNSGRSNLDGSRINAVPGGVRRSRYVVRGHGSWGDAEDIADAGDDTEPSSPYEGAGGNFGTIAGAIGLNVKSGGSQTEGDGNDGVGGKGALGRSSSGLTGTGGGVLGLKEWYSKRTALAKATNKVEGPPKAKYLRRLIVSSWKHNGAGASAILTLVAKRPLLTSPIVALKSLLTIHKLIQQGSPEALPACYVKLPMLQDIATTWAAPPSTSGVEGDSYRGLITSHTLILIEKAAFHHRFPAYENNYSVDFTITGPAASAAEGKGKGGGISPREDNDPLNIEALACLQKIQDQILRALEEGFALIRKKYDAGIRGGVGNGTAGNQGGSGRGEKGHSGVVAGTGGEKDPIGLVVAVMIPILREADLLYDICWYLLSMLVCAASGSGGWEGNGWYLPQKAVDDLNLMVVKFGVQHRVLRSLFEQARSEAAIAGSVTPPVLPLDPPRLPSPIATPTASPALLRNVSRHSCSSGAASAWDGGEGTNVAASKSGPLDRALVVHGGGGGGPSRRLSVSDDEGGEKERDRDREWGREREKGRVSISAAVAAATAAHAKVVPVDKAYLDLMDEMALANVDDGPRRSFGSKTPPPGDRPVVGGVGAAAAAAVQRFAAGQAQAAADLARRAAAADRERMVQVEETIRRHADDLAWRGYMANAEVALTPPSGLRAVRLDPPPRDTLGGEGAASGSHLRPSKPQHTRATKSFGSFDGDVFVGGEFVGVTGSPVAPVVTANQAPPAGFLSPRYDSAVASPAGMVSPAVTSPMMQGRAGQTHYMGGQMAPFGGGVVHEQNTYPGMVMGGLGVEEAALMWQQQQMQLQLQQMQQHQGGFQAPHQQHQQTTHQQGLMMMQFDVAQNPLSPNPNVAPTAMAYEGGYGMNHALPYQPHPPQQQQQAAMETVPEVVQVNAPWMNDNGQVTQEGGGGIGAVNPGRVGVLSSIRAPSSWQMPGSMSDTSAWENFLEGSEGGDGDDRERRKDALGTSCVSSQGSAMVVDWEIPFLELKLGPKIGQGAFGDVVRGVWQGTDVAVKRLQNVAAASFAQASNDFRREVALVYKLRHPNVILFMGACTSPPDLCIVMEYAAHGSLYGVLRNPNVTIDMPTVIRWATEAARGMNYLHTRCPPIVHRDLKSVNLLVDGDWHIKVSDFGLAMTKANSYAHTQVGTWGWMAPEVLDSSPYDEKADVYSFGVVLWELITREEPFKGCHPMQIMRAIDRGERPLIPDSCPIMYRQLVQDCWQVDSKCRPTFEVILERLTAMGMALMAEQQQR